MVYTDFVTSCHCYWFNMSEDITFNVGFAGEAGVGKTSIITRVMVDSFESSQGSTIGTVFHRKDLSWEGHNMTLCLIDTAGQEQFRSMTVVYFVNVAMAVIVFSISDQNWKTNISNIIEQIRSRNQTCPVLLVANKTDLRDIDFSEIEAWQTYADTNGYRFISVSAKNGAGFDELQHLMCELLWENYEKQLQENSADFLQVSNEKACCR